MSAGHFFTGGIPDGDQAGIYALVDDEGKHYIGSAINLRKRLLTHDMGLWHAHKGEHDAFESQALQDAVMEGRTFRIVLLAVFPAGIDTPLLRQVERDYIHHYASAGDIYNDRVRGRRSKAIQRGKNAKAEQKAEQ